MRTPLKLSVIVPFFNEQDSIGPLYAAIVGAVDPLQIPFEMVFGGERAPYCCRGTDRLSCALQSLRLNPLCARPRISQHPCHRLPALKNIHSECKAPDQDVAPVAQRISGTR